jgi:iron complex transport system substrate-binding protein
MKGLIFSAFIILLCLGVNAPAAPPRRIISLAPAITEILYALGLEDMIVAVTTFCDYPPGAKEKPKIGGMSNPSLEAVVSLKPDIVVMTTDGNPKGFEERLRKFGIKTYVFTARQIPELPRAIRDLGDALGVRERAETLAKEIETTIDKFKDRNRKSDSRTMVQKTRKALFIIWPGPLIVAGPGTAVDDALTLIGAENVAGDSVTQYPKYSIEEIIARPPDVIFIGKGMTENMKELSQGIMKKLDMLDAVKKDRVYYTSDALYRLGPRVVDGIEELNTYLEKD